jgi:protein-tyrosine-phosphatase
MLITPSHALPHGRVLILDGHCKASAEVVLSLPKSCELHVAAAHAQCLSFASTRVAQKLIQPAPTEALSAWIAEQDSIHSYQLIVASTEASLLALKSESLNPQLRAKAVLSSEASIDIALSKEETARVAEKLGIRVPQGRVIDAHTPVAPADQFPLVIKPLRSKVWSQEKLLSLAASVCADEAQRQAALKHLLPHTPVVEQAYFAGRGVGVEALFEHGQLRWLFAHERLHEMPITGGASTYRRAYNPPPAVRDAAIKLLTHLQWHGVAMVEFKVAADGQDYRLIEINPRLWGSLPLAVGAGVNFPLGLLHLALGQSPGPQPPATRCHYMRDIASDVRWFVQSWRQRGNPLLVKPLQASDFTALLRPLWGRERWDLFRLTEWSLWWANSGQLVQVISQRYRDWQARRLANRAATTNWQRLAPQWQSGQIQRVLVVCYGNICRSPLVGLMLSSALPNMEIRSTGLHPHIGRPPPTDWRQTVQDTLKLDLSEHRSQLACELDFAWAQLIIAMDAKNWHAIATQFPAHLARTTLLPAMAASAGAVEVPDPYARSTTEMRTIAQQIQQCVEMAAAQVRAQKRLT